MLIYARRHIGNYLTKFQVIPRQSCHYVIIWVIVFAVNTNVLHSFFYSRPGIWNFTFFGRVNLVIPAHYNRLSFRKLYPSYGSAKCGHYIFFSKGPELFGQNAITYSAGKVANFPGNFIKHFGGVGYVWRSFAIDHSWFPF